MSAEDRGSSQKNAKKAKDGWAFHELGASRISTVHVSTVLSPSILRTDPLGALFMVTMRILLEVSTCRKLAGGGTLADAMMHAQGLQAHQSILGDPTLRMRPLAPVRGLRAVKNGFDVTLTWNLSADSDTSYYIYRAEEGVFGLPLPGTPTQEDSFTETGVSGFPVTYQVKACRLVTTGAGSYWDLSQGMSVEVQ